MPERPIALVVADDDAHWLRAARASGQHVSAYHHPRFLRAAASTTRRTLRPLVVRYGSTDVGVATWLENRRGPVASVNRVPFPYAGPLVPPELLAPTLAELRRHGLRRGVAIQTQQFTPQTHVDLAALTSWGEVIYEDTYVVRTDGTPDELDHRMVKKGRQQMRRALREGVSAMVLTDPRHAARALDLTMGSIYAVKSHGSGYREPLGITPADLVGEGLQVQWLLATRGDEDLGCLLSVAYQDSAVAWLGGVAREHRSTQANLVLYRAAVGWAASVGAAGLDLSGNPSPQIRSFKKQFGGDLLTYPTVTHHDRWARSALAARRRLLSASGRAERVGP